MAHLARLFACVLFVSTTLASGLAAAASSGADLELRLSAMEEALRELRGAAEENDHKVRQLSESLDKMQKDNDYRFNELSGGKAAHASSAQLNPETPSATAAATPTEGRPAPVEFHNSESRPPVNSTPAPPTGETTAGDGVLRPPSYDTPEYATPRDLYNYAFRLLNQTKYEQSADAFGTFIKKYPKDPLVGNAYYWQGETFYIRHDYVNAADAFRQGFETLPNGPKAADNLLKLAMSLSALDRNKEACIVLTQITTKYSRQSIGVSDKAKGEQRRIGC